jgi:hypothetical protein
MLPLGVSPGSWPARRGTLARFRRHHPFPRLEACRHQVDLPSIPRIDVDQRADGQRGARQTVPVLDILRPRTARDGALRQDPVHYLRQLIEQRMSTSIKGGADHR